MGFTARSGDLMRFRARLDPWFRAALTRLAEFARLGGLAARRFEAGAEACLSPFGGSTAASAFHVAVLKLAAGRRWSATQLARATAATATAATAATPPASPTLAAFTALRALAVLADLTLCDGVRDLARRGGRLGGRHRRRHFLARRPLA